MNKKLNTSLWIAILQSFHDSKDYGDCCIISVADKEKHLKNTSIYIQEIDEVNEIPEIELVLMKLKEAPKEIYSIEIIDIMRRTDGTITPTIDRKDYLKYFKKS